MFTLFRDGRGVTVQELVNAYHEIAIVLKAAGLKINSGSTINPDNYHDVEPLIGSELFSQLKAQHLGAFHDAPAKTLETT